jgi:hypothetical protein
MEQRTAAVSQAWHHSGCVVFSVPCPSYLSVSPSPILRDIVLPPSLSAKYSQPLASLDTPDRQRAISVHLTAQSHGAKLAFDTTAMSSLISLTHREQVSTLPPPFSVGTQRPLQEQNYHHEQRPQQDWCKLQALRCVLPLLVLPPRDLHTSRNTRSTSHIDQITHHHRSVLPSCVRFGTECDYNAMVVDLLGSSLEDLFNFCNRRSHSRRFFFLPNNLLVRFVLINS